MQFRRHGFVTALLMIMSLLLAACGGSEQSSGPTATAPPVAQRQSATPTATPIQSTTTPTTPPTVLASPTPTQHTSPTVAPSPTTSPTAVPSATPTKKTEPMSKPTKASKPATPTNTPEPTNTPTPQPTNTPSPTSTPTKPPAPTATPTQAPKVGMPSRLLINTDDVHVDSHVEYVGQTPDGAMDVPKKWEDVAWYQPGYAPGSKGNSVIAGHLDSTTGPAVFIDLDKIQVGDIITVVDKNGQKLDFKVTKTAVYYNDKAPLFDIFGPSDTADLNLITCDGAWNEGKKEYNQKLVVFSTLVSDSGDNSG